jgi:choline dehydrogenase-like flavoprotein
MKISDLRNLPAGSIFNTDLCIVGGGPAGLTIATEFANSGRDVLVLESGGRHREDAFTDALNEVENLGFPRQTDQRRVRSRVFGGASHNWSGRCAPLDEIDYQPRAWVPHSGWPVSAQEMAPFIERAANHLGLLPMDYDQSLLADLKLPQHFNGQDGTELQSVFWQFSRQSSVNDDYVRFGPRFAKLSANNLRVLTHATVTNIGTNDDGSHVRELEIRSPEGTIHHARARYFILCGGGVDNPRILLASNRVDPRGVGNRRDLVGRYLNEHPRALLGTFEPSSVKAVQSEVHLFRHSSGVRMQRGVSLTYEVQRREQLLNCAAWTTQHVAADDVWRALRSIGRNNDPDRLALSRVVLRNADHLIAGLWNKFVRRRPLPRRMAQFNLDAIIEQAPNPDSRITLSSRKDTFGVPLPAIDWKIGEMERRTALYLAHAVNRGLASVGLPTAVLVDWVRDWRPEDAVFMDPAHPSGTTRMASSQASGVVDTEGKVFGVDNLYIAGSSVFPTSGHANPTLMIIALALRVADALRRPSAWNSASAATGVSALPTSAPLRGLTSTANDPEPFSTRAPLPEQDLESAAITASEVSNQRG